MKLSKAAKARIKRMTLAERKQLLKAATLLADNEVITHSKWASISRTLHSSSKM